MAQGRKQTIVKDFVERLTIRKKRLWYVVISLFMAATAWIGFLVYFGRIEPVIRATLKKEAHLYTYGLITAPFWTYSFGAPVVFPIIAAYILNGNWRLGLFSQVAGISLIIILGSLLNISSLLLHAIEHLDHNKKTVDIVTTGLVAIILAILNLIVIQIAIPLFEWYSLSTEPTSIPLQFRGTPMSSGSSRNYMYSDDDFTPNKPLLPSSPSPPSLQSPPYNPSFNSRDSPALSQSFRR